VGYTCPRRDHTEGDWGGIGFTWGVGGWFFSPERVVSQLVVKLISFWAIRSCACGWGGEIPPEEIGPEP
jgi:hypothetical protein